MSHADDMFDAAMAENRRAQEKLEADQKRFVEPSQADHPGADGLLRRFAERMRGTERTDIIVGLGPATTAYVKRPGLFSRRIPYPAHPSPEVVRGWAFIAGPPPHGSYVTETVARGTGGLYDPPATKQYRILAVDVTGQLYLVRCETPPTELGLVNTPNVLATNGQRFPRACQWNGVGVEVLSWCAAQQVAYTEEAIAIETFLAPGLAAALQQLGR